MTGQRPGAWHDLATRLVYRVIVRAVFKLVLLVELAATSCWSDLGVGTQPLSAAPAGTSF